MTLATLSLILYLFKAGLRIMFSHAYPVSVEKQLVREELFELDTMLTRMMRRSEYLPHWWTKLFNKG